MTWVLFFVFGSRASEKKKKTEDCYLHRHLTTLASTLFYWLKIGKLSECCIFLETAGYLLTVVWNTVCLRNGMKFWSMQSKVQLSCTSELNYIFLSGYVDSQDRGLICCVVLLKGCVMILSLFSLQLQVSNATVAPIGHKVSSEQSSNRQTHELLTTTLRSEVCSAITHTCSSSINNNLNVFVFCSNLSIYKSLFLFLLFPVTFTCNSWRPLKLNFQQ